MTISPTNEITDAQIIRFAKELAGETIRKMESRSPTEKEVAAKIFNEASKHASL